MVKHRVPHAPLRDPGAVPADEDQLLAVAHHLNTVNLPDDRTAISGILDHSQKSFTGAIKDPKRREYVFVLVDTASKRSSARRWSSPSSGGRTPRTSTSTSSPGALLGDARQALFAHDAQHRILVQRADRDRRAHPGAGVSQGDRAARAVHLVRALSVHPDAPDSFATRCSPSSSRRSSRTGRRTSGTRSGTSSPGSPTQRPTGSRSRTRSSSGALPRGAHLRDAAQREGAGSDREGRRPDARSREDAPADRLPLRERVDPFDGGPHFTAPTDEVTLVQRAHAAKVAKISARSGRRAARSWRWSRRSRRTSAASSPVHLDVGGRRWCSARRRRRTSG